MPAAASCHRKGLRTARPKPPSASLLQRGRSAGGEGQALPSLQAGAEQQKKSRCRGITLAAILECIANLLFLKCVSRDLWEGQVGKGSQEF